MKWQVQIDTQTQHCDLPAHISEGVPFKLEERLQCMWQGRHGQLWHDMGDGLCLEETLTLWGYQRSPLAYGRNKVQVLYATRAGKVHSCRAEVGLAAVAMPRQKIASQQDSEVLSPLTGKVIKVLVTKAAQVHKDDALLIIEAMKMENVVQAERHGTVATLHVKVGDAVRSGDVLLSLRGKD